MTTNQVGVGYTLSAFKRAGFVGGGKALLLRADQEPGVALAALRASTVAVNEALYEYEGRDEAYVVIDGPVPTPAGPIARVQDCEPAKALPLMLDRLAAELTARGITGRLVPASTFKGVGISGQNALGMLCSPLTETDAMYAAFEDWRRLPAYRGLWVEEGRHRRVVTTLVEWVTQVEGTVLIHVVDLYETDPAALVPYLTQALHSDSRLGFSVTSPDRRTRREVQFADSEIICYDYGPDQPRRAQLASLTDLATRLAPDLAYALVRELRTSMIRIDDCRKVPPNTPLFNDLRHPFIFKHLEPDYVFDAGVAQVLTTSQLAKTTLPPDRWTVTDLGADRHLVTANNPDPWLHPDPHYVHPNYDLPPDWSDPEVLAAARADFGPAIMTVDTLRQHPPPLTPEQIRTDPTLRSLGVTPPS